MGKEIKAEERGRRLTFGSKGEKDSGFVDRYVGECSTERKFKGQRMKSEKMNYDGLFIGTRENGHWLISNNWC